MERDTTICSIIRMKRQKGILVYFSSDRASAIIVGKLISQEFIVFTCNVLPRVRIKQQYLHLLFST